MIPISNRNWFSIFSLSAALVLGSLWVHAQVSKTDDGPQPRTIAPRGPLTQSELSTIELFEQSSPSVVHIESIAVRRGFFSMNLTKIPAGTGTGFIWDDQGHIVTNFHVIQKANAAHVILSDQSTWRAEFVGADPDKDLAVLKIDAPRDRLIPIKVGSSKDLRVGQAVMAIGNPFGLDQTLTTGVISGLGREIEAVTGRTIHGVIQTDAAINPGNSGGPLLDSAGRLIGVNTAIYSPSGAFAGVGFAVPADEVNRLVPQIVQHGRVIKPVLGVSIADDNLLRRQGVDGVLIMNVIKNTGAEKAGLLPTRRSRSGEVMLGDLIVAVDGAKVRDSEDLFEILEKRQIGDSVTVTIIRGNQTLATKVTLTGSKD